jgi:hypothetical protein
MHENGAQRENERKDKKKKGEREVNREWMSRIQIWFCYCCAWNESVTETWRRENTQPYSIFIVIIYYFYFSPPVESNNSGVSSCIKWSNPSQSPLNQLTIGFVIIYYCYKVFKF